MSTCNQRQRFRKLVEREVEKRRDAEAAARPARRLAPISEVIGKAWIKQWPELGRLYQVPAPRSAAIELGTKVHQHMEKLLSRLGADIRQRFPQPFTITGRTVSAPSWQHLPVHDSIVIENPREVFMQTDYCAFASSMTRLIEDANAKAQRLVVKRADANFGYPTGLGFAGAVPDMYPRDRSPFIDCPRRYSYRHLAKNHNFFRHPLAGGAVQSAATTSDGRPITATVPCDGHRGDRHDASRVVYVAAHSRWLCEHCHWIMGLTMPPQRMPEFDGR